MPRPREFDETAIAKAATKLFWNRGFRAPSRHDLAKCIGLTTARPYNAYGDNRMLYRQIPERYAKDVLGSCGDLLREP